MIEPQLPGPLINGCSKDETQLLVLAHRFWIGSCAGLTTIFNFRHWGRLAHESFVPGGPIHSGLSHAAFLPALRRGRRVEVLSLGVLDSSGDRSVPGLTPWTRGSYGGTAFSGDECAGR
jgi:hypothetical protein